MARDGGPSGDDFWIRGDCLVGREFVRGGALHVAGGRVAAVGRLRVPPGARVVSAPGALVLPGLVELHVHGALGRDVADGDEASVAALRTHLAAQGVTGFVAAVVSSPERRTLLALDALAGAARSPGPRLLGVLLEGPFLAPAKRGAHRRSCLRPPDPALLDRLLDRVPPGVRASVLLAPELPGATELLLRARARGALVCLGHSEADYDCARAALAAGASYGIHVWNAMPPLLHRAPGLVGALLDDPSAVLELIPDLVHVHPAVLRVTVRAVGVGRVALVTDTTGPAGLEPGPRRWDGRTVFVGPDGLRLSDGTLAGSNLDTAGLFQAMEGLGFPLADVVRMRSAVPARLLGLGRAFGVLAPGRPAHVTVLDGERRVAATVVDGRLVHGAATHGRPRS